MNRKEIVLAAMAPAKGRTHTPVQLQKLFFLIDRKVPDKVAGPHFDFQPYDYGPFDKDVYTVLETLAAEALVEAADTGRSWKMYSLTPDGQRKGEELLGSLDPTTKDYIERLSTFVRSLSFPELVSAIYKAFPAMKVNSVFRE